MPKGIGFTGVINDPTKISTCAPQRYGGNKDVFGVHLVYEIVSAMRVLFETCANLISTTPLAARDTRVPSSGKSSHEGM